MTSEIIKIEDNLLTIRLQGIMRLADQEAAQRRVAGIIDRFGSAKMLVVAENFQGWSNKDDWGNMSFLMEYGDSVSKIAFVGDERWKENAFMFSGKGLRETEIEFFTHAHLDEAERWVRL